MAERRIDREAWATLLAELIASETRAKKAPFARLVGVDPKSITLWLTCAVDVSEESVRRVARALGRSPLEMLIRVGYYSPNDIGQPQAAPPAVGEDPVILAIHDAPVPPHKKVEMVERIRERRARLREAQQEDEMAEVRWWIQQQRGA